MLQRQVYSLPPEDKVAVVREALRDNPEALARFNELCARFEARLQETRP